MTQAETRRFKHIVEFSEHIDKDRVGVFRLLKKNDPDTWEAYAAFRKERKEKAAERVKKAKAQIAQLQTT